MKRVLYLFMIFSIILNFNYIFAEEVERGDLIDEFIFEVSDKMVIKQDSEHAIVSFKITNPTAEYYPEVYYVPYLHVLIDQGEFYTSQRYINYTPIKFEIYANETKTITYDFILPKRLPKMGYAVGFGFEVKEHTLSLADELILLDEISSNQEGFLIPEGDPILQLGTEEYFSDIGPNISSESTPKAVVELKSTFDTEKRVIPEFTLYRRSIVSNNIPVSVTYGEPISIKPGERKKISLDLPTIKAPEAYLIMLSFVDESMLRVSMQYDYRYVVEGISANIGIIKANQLDSNIEVVTTILGPADTSTLKGATVLCEIESYGRVLASKEIIADLNTEFYNMDLILENITVDKATTAKVHIKVLYNGKEITKKEQEIKLVATTPGEKPLSDVIGTKYEEAVTALNSLGILNGYLDGTFKPENTISRAEFAAIAIKLGEHKVQDIEASTFSDVVKEHWAKNYINTCVNKGIVSGYLDGTFKPDNNVNYAESITILLNVLGYKIEINNSGLGWPYNYLKKSSQLRIHNQSDYSDYFLPATRGDIAILTYNAYLRR